MLFFYFLSLFCLPCRLRPRRRPESRQRRRCRRQRRRWERRKEEEEEALLLFFFDGIDEKKVEQNEREKSTLFASFFRRLCPSFSSCGFETDVVTRVEERQSKDYRRAGVQQRKKERKAVVDVAVLLLVGIKFLEQKKRKERTKSYRKAS